MASQPDIRIYRLAAFLFVLTVSSYIIPGFVPNPSGDFAGSGPAIVTFLVLLGVDFIFSIYLFAVTLQQFKVLSITAKLVGLGPCLLFGIALISLFGNPVFFL